ncbi:hypothetical protein NMG60_11003325 [Bertholletia excelsa]
MSPDLQLIPVMGNVSGRKDEACSSGTKNEEEYMEFGHGEADVGSYHAHGGAESMVQSPPHSPRDSRVPVVSQNTMTNEYMLYGTGVTTMITWSYNGKQVAIEGSWDNWKTRDYLEKSGKDFSIMKVLPPAVYYCRFIVDGQWRNSPGLPLDCDESGNVFNILDLRDHAREVSELPSSPVSSYDSLPLSIEDYNEKVPEFPPLLHQSPLDQPSSSSDCPECLEQPMAAVLNHLYIQKGRSGQSLVALSSTNRFRSKFVTVMLYKPLKKVKK